MKGIYINNDWHNSAEGGLLEVVNPSDGTTITSVAAAGARDVGLAVNAARSAFEEDWGAIDPAERARLLFKMAELIRQNSDELARLEMLGVGKSIQQTSVDVKFASRYFEFYGGAADKLHGLTIPYGHNFQAIAQRVPLGVTAHIIAWNYPIQMFARAVAPALAAGNAVVIKPAEEACLSAIRLAELSKEAGFPAGALNVLTGKGAIAGQALSAHPDIDFVSFIGSNATGRLVQEAAAQHHTPCSLELGGKSPHIVFDDADLNRAIPVIVNAIIQNAGQTCSAGSRVLVQKSIYPMVCERLADAFRRLRVGAPHQDVDLGPVISRVQQETINTMCHTAVANGAHCLAQGSISPDAPANGFYVAPRLFADVDPAAPIVQKEVFGPVLVAMPFADEDEACRLANSTQYALVAGVWARDGARALRVSKRVVAGQVFVNCYGAGGGVELPFGGMKRSGFGREKGFEALYGMTTVKTVVTDHS